MAKVFQLLDGHKIPLFGLGTYQLRRQSDVDKAIDAALASGYRLFDTANYYANESELGISFEKLLPKHNLTRSDIFIITKANIISKNLKSFAINMIENSLLKLKTNYIDLVLIHYPCDWGALDSNPKNSSDRLEIWKIFEEYKDADKIRSIGVSNFEINHIEELWNVAKYKPTVNQCEFHPHLVNTNLIKYCKEKAILFQAHTPLAKNSKALYNNSVLINIANTHNASIQQILLAFAYCQNICVLPKSGNPSRISSNFDAIKIKLSDEELIQLNALNRNIIYSDCKPNTVL